MNKSLNCHIDAVASSEKLCISKTNLLRIGSQSFVYVLAVSIAIAMSWLLPAIYVGANGEQMSAQHNCEESLGNIIVASANVDKLPVHSAFGSNASLHDTGLIAGR